MNGRFFTLTSVKFPITHYYVALRSCFKDGEAVCPYSSCRQCSENLWFCNYYCFICFLVWELRVQLLTAVHMAVRISAETWKS